MQHKTDDVTGSISLPDRWLFGGCHCYPYVVILMATAVISAGIGRKDIRKEGKLPALILNAYRL